jgi:aldehyde dehydrogenase (NAD+)
VEPVRQRNQARPWPLVDGEWIEDGGLFAEEPLVDLDPSTGHSLADVPVPRAAVAERAMAAAYSAWQGWRHESLSQRCKQLLRLADALERRRESIVPLIQTETGILYERAQEEVSHGVELLQETARLKTLRRAFIAQKNMPRATVDPVPFGVVVWILSWNSPIAALCKIGAALMAGNTAVLKASHHAPLCAFAFAEAVQDSGFPPGVVNVLWDRRGELATDLVRHPALGKCAFTGRPATARNVLAGISSRGVRPTFMETGGGGVQVVFDDADLDAVIPHVFWGAFTLSGQICCAGTRILAHERILERLVAELGGGVQSLQVGSAHDRNTQLGPVISREEVARLTDLADRGARAGAALLATDVAIPESGFFVRPQIALTDDVGGPFYGEEIFGPIVVVTPFRHRSEVIDRLERLQSGLALALYTSDRAWVLKHASDLVAGTVWLNGYYQSTVQVPFGGMKDSGYGREKGIAGLREFSQERVMVLGERAA